MMTIQETFDKAVLAVLKQGKKAIDGTSYFCRYKTIGGLKCAVGHLILDEYLSDEILNYNPNLQVNYDRCSSDVQRHGKLLLDALSRSDVPTDAIRMLTELQSAHDDANDKDFCNSFTNLAKMVSKQNMLTFPVVE